MSLLSNMCYNLKLYVMGKRWEEALRFIGIGWYIAVCIILGVLGGRWLGHKLGGSTNEVIFTLLGLALGLIVAFF